MPENSKQKTVKQNVKGKIAPVQNIPPVQILPRTTPNPSNPIIEDVSDNQPNNKQQSNTFPPVGNVEEIVEVSSEIPSNQNFIHEKEKNVEDPKNRENPTVQNTKTQTEKPFNLEAEIGKLKIVVPLS